MEPSLKKSTENFIQNTSVRGVNRITKSDTVICRVMWATAVSAGIVFGLYSCVSLVCSYYDYDVRTVVKVYQLLSKEDSDYLFTTYNMGMPDLTLCNLNYLSSNPPKPGTMTRQEYSDRMTKHFSDLYKSSYNHTELQDFIHYIYNNGYLHNINKSEAADLAHKAEVFIHTCFYYFLLGETEVRKECSEVATIRPIYHEQYHQCYTVSLNRKLKQGYAYSLDVILYLDNFYEAGPYFDTHTDFQQENGALVAYHEPGSFPDSCNSVTIAPGTHNNLEFGYIVKKGLPPPHGICTDGAELQLYDISNTSVNYNIMGCYSGCYHSLILKKCKCVDPKLTVILGHLPDDFDSLPSCLALNWNNVSEIFDTGKCKRDAEILAYQHCLNLCKPQCTQVTYNCRLSNTKWPSPQASLAFYKVLVKPQPYSHLFKAYEEILEKVQNSSITMNDAIQATRQIGLIEENFIKLSFRSVDMQVTELATEPTLTSTYLMSNIGGTLNLYAGINILLIFELVELLGWVGYGMYTKIKTYLIGNNKINVKTFEDSKYYNKH